MRRVGQSKCGGVVWVIVTACRQEQNAGQQPAYLGEVKNETKRWQQRGPRGALQLCQHAGWELTRSIQPQDSPGRRDGRCTGMERCLQVVMAGQVARDMYS